jgi:hypothetical protein
MTAQGLNIIIKSASGIRTFKLDVKRGMNEAVS